MALPLPRQHAISVYATSKKRSTKQAHITPLFLAISTIGICLLLNLFSTLYANSIKSPMGSVFNQKEKEYDTISNHYYSIQNECAYYNSTQLIRKKATEDLNMNTPTKTVTIEHTQDLAEVNESQ